VNAICLPSGDQVMPPGARSSRVNCSVSRVSAHITWSCVDPDRSDRKAMRLPSGDQTGDESLQAPSVNCRSRSPDAFTAQRFDRF
jgi:hypothetical protein